MEELSSVATSTSAEDTLFLERFEAFMERSIADMQAFANREHRPLAEIKQRASEWHCNRLFALSPEISSASRKTRINLVLQAVSTALESLYAVAGLHSFVLAVDPNDEGNEGFLGGTLLGREFWRTMRGCGTNGARLFKAQAIKAEQNADVQTNSTFASSTSTPSPHLQLAKKGPAAALKAEVYAAMRSALRAVSGMRNAEMKWTNHSNLSTYGVKLEGWPADVPCQNPSSLSTAQNNILLEALQSGAMKFVTMQTTGLMVPASPPVTTSGTQDSDAVFSWLVEVNAGAPAPAESPSPRAPDSEGSSRKRQRTDRTDGENI